MQMRRGEDQRQFNDCHDYVSEDACPYVQPQASCCAECQHRAHREISIQDEQRTEDEYQGGETGCCTSASILVHDRRVGRNGCAANVAHLWPLSLVYVTMLCGAVWWPFPRSVWC